MSVALAQRPVRFVVSASDAKSDAPTVADLLGQLGDIVGVLQEVEQAIAEGGGVEIEWRVTDARRSSPLAFEITPFPKRHGMNIDNRSREVRDYAAKGLLTLAETGERPTYFADATLKRAERIFGRVTNGLATTTVEFADDLPPVALTADTARAAAQNAARVQKPEDRPYREIGSVEGYFNAVERDGFGRALLRLRVRLTGDVVKCVVRGAAFEQVSKRQIGEVWQRRQRLLVYGTIHYEAVGRMSQIEADDLRVLRGASDLPQVEDILDSDFTGGVRTEDYLAELRGGDGA